MRCRNLGIVVTLVGAFLVAGCADAPEPAPLPVDTRPELSAFTGCPWSYPDNTSMDCTYEAPHLTAQGSVPTTSLCVERNENQDWSLHWDPIAGTRGIWYEAPENASGTQGTLYVRTGGAEHLFTWNDAPRQGYLEIPIEFGENVSFRYAFHDVGYAANGTLAGAEGRPVWSIYERQWWVLHRFDAADASYSFQNITAQSFRVDTPDNTDEVTYRNFYTVGPFFIDGKDFTLIVHHATLHTATSQGAVDTIGFDRFCQLGSL